MSCQKATACLRVRALTTRGPAWLRASPQTTTARTPGHVELLGGQVGQERCQDAERVLQEWVVQAATHGQDQRGHYQAEQDRPAAGHREAHGDVGQVQGLPSGG